MLCIQYGTEWRKADTRVGNTVSVPHRLAVFLHWMAFGATRRQLAHTFGISDTLVSEICDELTHTFTGSANVADLEMGVHNHAFHFTHTTQKAGLFRCLAKP